LPAGLRHIARTLQAIVAARPDAVTMHKGIAGAAWAPYAGTVPLIMQSTIARVDDSACEQIATPEDAVRLGADGFAVAAFVRGDNEAAHLRTVAEAVRDAARYEMPVICHIYPRVWRAETVGVSYEPEDIAWAVRCALECGVDVVKVPYCGSVAAYAEIVSDCPVPVVAAGGPQTRTPEAALSAMADVVASGARGATIGRNIWNAADVTATVRAFQAVIHDGKTPQQALLENGLAVRQPA
jgi:fructose-bisphosphate aldolase, class I